jgi:multiple sugar transport system ATP-binding protein
MAAISLSRITKSFGRAGKALADVELSIEDGEFVTLVGPSGCGKSTLLNVIAGLEEPTSGAVLIDGIDVTKQEPGDRDLAMVFQSYALYPHMTVRKNIAFPLENARVARDVIEERVRGAAVRLQIDALLDRKPRELSGGQRQRVALARAIVRRPRAFLFDEPLSNLDASLRLHMRAELKKLHEELGATFVYVTHDQVEAMTLSDRVVVLRSGVVQQVGPPRSIYDRPENVFVASFFGSPPVNLVKPEMIGHPREGALVAIRPENVVVSLESGALQGDVYLVEPVGSMTFVTVSIGDERIVGRAPPGFTAPAGTRAFVTIDTRDASWFDATSGTRVQSAA